MTRWRQSGISANPEDELPLVFYPFINRKRSGTAVFQRALSRPNLLQPTLVATEDTSARLVHPLCLPESTRQCEKVRRDRRSVIFVTVAYFAACLVALFLLPEYRQLIARMMAFLAVIGAYCSLDYWLTFRSNDDLKDRANYYAWLFIKSPRYVYGFLIFYLLSGVLQWQDTETFLARYALLFDLPSNEPWRFMTGSLIHASLAHWLTNLVMCLGVVALCAPSLGLMTMPVFVGGGTLSFLATYVFESHFSVSSADGLVGTSGGIAALLGCMIGLTLRYPASYPKRLGFTVMYFLLVNSILGAIFQANTSLACHLAGAGVGAFVALFLPDRLAAGGGSPTNTL